MKHILFSIFAFWSVTVYAQLQPLPIISVEGKLNTEDTSQLFPKRDTTTFANGIRNSISVTGGASYKYTREWHVDQIGGNNATGDGSC